MFNYDTWSDSEGDWTDVDCMSTDEDHAKELDRLVICPGCIFVANVKLLADDLQKSEFRLVMDCTGIVQAVREMNLVYHCHIYHADHSDSLANDLNQSYDHQQSGLPSTSANLPVAQDPPAVIKKRGRPRKQPSTQPRDTDGRFTVPSKLGQIFLFRWNYWPRRRLAKPKTKPKHLIVKMKFPKLKKGRHPPSPQTQLPLKIRLKKKVAAFSCTGGKTK